MSTYICTDQNRMFHKGKENDSLDKDVDKKTYQHIQGGNSYAYKVFETRIRSDSVTHKRCSSMHRE